MWYEIKTGRTAKVIYSHTKNGVELFLANGRYYSLNRLYANFDKMRSI